MIKPEETKKRYYNLSRSIKDPWYMYSDKKLTIGQKISVAKKGKSTGPFTKERKRAISEAKRASFERRLAETGNCYSFETLSRMRFDAQAGRKQGDDEKNRRAAAVRAYHTANQTTCEKCGATLTLAHRSRHKCPPPKVMPGARIKELWADPEWAATQRALLKEARVKRAR